jgi:peptide deformylase
MNATQEPGDDRVYVNPVLSDAEGDDEQEEGCLSLPGIHVNVARGKQVRMQARDLDGRPIDEVATGFVARVWQHEFDHLNGTLLTDRMGPVARMANRRILNELKEQYEVLHPPVKRAKRKV